jgi:hypothetical protein
LQDFIDKGIEVSNAIDKIDFSNLTNNIYEAYSLLDKIKANGREYEQDDYKLLIAANKSLEDKFI